MRCQDVFVFFYRDPAGSEAGAGGTVGLRVVSSSVYRGL